MNSIPSMEEQFTKKLIEIIEANFNNEQFGVSDLAREMGMSRATLHRKTKSITAKTISQFINEVRLKAAKQLLTDRSGTVSEVAYMVGFKSSNYFIKCFGDFYGYPPGKLLNGKTSEPDDSLNNTTKKKFPVYLTVAAMLVLISIIIFAVKEKFANDLNPDSVNNQKLLTTNQAALNLYQQGLNLMEVYKGSIKEVDFLEAKKRFEEAVQIDSTFGDAYAHIANIYLSHIPFSPKTNKGFNYADSGRFFLDKAEHFGVVDKEYLLNISSHYYQRRGEYAKALELFEKLWENKEKDYIYYLTRGNHGFHARNYSDGIGYTLKYLELKPDSVLPAHDRLLKLTLLFSRAGFPKEAQEFAYQQFQRNNDTIKYWNWYPLITFENGNFDEAIKTYETAHRYKNVSLTVYNKLLEIYLLTENHNDALKLLPDFVEFCHTKYKKAIPNYLLGYYHYLNNEKELAQWHLKEEIKRWEYFCSRNKMQQSIQNYITIASCYSMLGDKNGTIKSLEKLYEKTSIPYLVIIKLQSSPKFDNFKEDTDFIVIKNRIEKKYYEEHSKIERILAPNPITYSFNQEGTIASTPL